MFSFRIAQRYIWGITAEKNIATMVKVSFLSIFIGSFALALVAAVMRGFEHETHEKMQSIHAQINIRAYNDLPLDYEALAPMLREHKEIESFSPHSTRQAIIQTKDSNDITHVVALKGVVPETEAMVSALGKKITHTITGKNSMTEALANNGLLIGSKLAQELGIKAGDAITMLFTPDEQAQSNRVTLRSIDATVGGIFTTGIEEFDAGLTLCSLPLFDTIFPESGITTVALKLTPGADEQTVIATLKNELELDVYSWKELYPALVSALKLEKIVMFLILSLIVLVAIMNIIALLFMHITQKRGDIAILKSMGLSDSQCCNIFMYMGMSISFVACSAGLLLACVASYFLERYPFIVLPDTYYVDHVPARMELSTVVLIFAVIMVMSYIIIHITTNRARAINIATVLRFEA